MNSFIATLGMGSILSATQVIVSHNAQPLPPTSTGWNNFTQTDVGGFQIVVLYLLIIAFVLWWMTAHTPAGRYLYAIGGNPEAARLSGVRIERYTRLALVTSATIAGVAGIMFCSLNGPSLNFGGTLLLPAFAAAFLGSTQLIPGRFNVWGTLLAIYVLATGRAGAAARVRGQLAERDVQRRRSDHRRRAVDPAFALRPLAEGQGALRARLRRRAGTTRRGCATGRGRRPGGDRGLPSRLAAELSHLRRPI